MKKLLRVFIMVAFTMLFTLVGVGCGEKPWYETIETEWDGEFLYYYDVNTDSYAIIGMSENIREYPEEEKDVVYIPTHYKGKEVRYSAYYFLDNAAIYGWGWDLTGICVDNVEKLYLSYITKPAGKQTNGREVYVYWHNFSSAKETYIVNTSYACYNETYLRTIKEDHLVYYTKRLYEVIVQNEEIADKEFVRDNLYSFTVKWEDVERTTMAANTAYMFNYEEEPNEGYFFINNFERGGKIENTPYEPIRNGYIFTGWYKDVECTEKWNFETDTLPQWEYDEAGNEIYVETKLYAGWTKK